MSITFEGLRTLNISYDLQHEYTESDYKKSLRVKKVVESVTKKGKISRGDIVIITAYNGQYYEAARVDSIHDSVNKVTVCEKPYIPFIEERDGKYKLSMSGGAFVAFDKDLFKFVGKKYALFHDWGHGGGRANGAIKKHNTINIPIIR